MGSFGVFLDEEMETLSKMFSSDDSDQFLLHFLSNNGRIPSNFLAHDQVNDELLLNQSGHHEFYHSSVITSNTHVDTYNPVDYKTDNLIMPVFTDHMMEEILQLKAQICNDQVGNAGIQDTLNDESCEEMQLRRKCGMSQVQIDHQNFKGLADKFEENSPRSPRKRSRVSTDTQKNKRNTQLKKNKKAVRNMSNDHVEEENNGGVINGQSSSSCSSEDDSNASQDLNDGSNSEAKNPKGKARASRGSATDPQSLYARRRRERINERLKILQNLVPNGTKVDISTMLEEAVNYVKFLQLQIKLLSSDELWMYAPIAYNGMDIGLHHKISPNLWS